MNKRKLNYSPIPQYNNTRPKLKRLNLKMKIYFKLEISHNFITCGKSNQEQDIDYNSKMVMIMDELISDIITKITLILVNNVSCNKEWININREVWQKHQKSRSIIQMNLIFTKGYFEINNITSTQSNEKSDVLNCE